MKKPCVGLCAVIAVASAAPLQYFYRENETSVSTIDEAGCVHRGWRPPPPVDVTGLSGPPFAFSFDCADARGGVTLAGVLRAGGGALALYLSRPASEGDDDASLVVNGRLLRTLGSMAWVQ